MMGEGSALKVEANSQRSLFGIWGGSTLLILIVLVFVQVNGIYTILYSQFYCETNTSDATKCSQAYPTTYSKTQITGVEVSA
eukprot:CAMPEP_0168607452 /NCGR_PEP_ID=MMETSP0449_2-20121227/50_1 /TAXON_ID=1082188 /ORGANISM="Strombidium rassoulzadegani, Strain ras09" /LENGTH=81 /DNA_ID=CAMNT_0008647269 /DNA_START=220 /DNA_END=465 /DNA_ORIENTATION=-